jgi:hypothetical protein
MPSRPILEAWRNTMSPGSSMCSLSSKPPALAWRRSLASAALRRSIGSRRRSSPSRLDQVKGVEEDAPVIAPVGQPVEKSGKATRRNNMMDV